MGLSFGQLVSWLSFFCFFAAALIHVGFFVFEFFLLPQPEYYKKLGYTDEQMKAVSVWAKNIAIYNLCLALGVFIGLGLIFKKQIMLAGALNSFCGVFMIVAGVSLWVLKPQLKKAAMLQFVPPAIGFLFLALHILERVGAL